MSSSDSAAIGVSPVSMGCGTLGDMMTPMMYGIVLHYTLGSSDWQEHNCVFDQCQALSVDKFFYHQYL